MMVTWEIGGPAAQSFEHWNERLMAVITPYAWIRALRTTYVVKLPDLESHTRIARAMGALAQDAPQGGVYVLMSPPLNGGQYVGSLQGDLWADLNKLTEDAQAPLTWSGRDKPN